MLAPGFFANSHQHRAAPKQSEYRAPGAATRVNGTLTTDDNSAGDLKRQKLEDGNVLSLPHFNYRTRDPRKYRELYSRTQHLDVLVTILHRSLLEGEYARARRAWAAIIRSRHHGQPFDFRFNGRWGIGAELLFFSQGVPPEVAYPSNLEAGRTSQSPSGASSPDFSQAKRYYERLLLQHNHRGNRTTLVSSADIYLPFFTLWLRSILDDAQLSVQHSHGDAAGPGHGVTHPIFYLSARTSMNAENREKVLAEIRLLTERLESALLSPPFSDQQGLWQLKGMISLFVLDLLKEDPAFDGKELAEFWDKDVQDLADSECTQLRFFADDTTEQTPPLTAQCATTLLEARKALARSAALQPRVEADAEAERV